MKESVKIKDNHLYLNYEIYDYGYKIMEKIIPIDRIYKVVETVGPQGGHYGWLIKDREDVERYQCIHEFGRDHYPLLNLTKELLEPLGIIFEKRLKDY